MLSVLPDAVVTTLGTPVTIHVLANDSGSGLTVTSFSNPAHGSVAFNADQSFTYTPTAGFAGADSFAYTVRDAQGTPSGAEVTITVAPNDGATRATDDYIETIAGGAVIIPVLANDLTASGPLQVVGVGVPGHGAANVLASQSIRYVPQAGFVGIDSFTYTVIDAAGTTTSATVTVKVLAANSAPVAHDDVFILEAGQTTVLAILANDSDPDGDPLQVVSYSMPSHGSLAFNPDKTFSYTPDAGFLGDDQFTYAIRDARGGSSAAGVTLTVIEIAEQPNAIDDHVVTEAGVPVTIDVLANDDLPADQQNRIVAVTLPFKGKIAFNPDGTITYTPNAGFTGFDDFTYTVGNGEGGTSKAIVTIEVTSATVANSYPNGYGYRRRIVVPAQGADQSTVNDAVILFAEEAVWLRSVENGGKVASPEGLDLRFELANGSKLDHEIEHYDPAGGKLLVWIRLPSWTLTQQIQIMVYYGNPSTSASEANPAGVWQGYLARWRLPDGGDATGSGRDLTPQSVLAGELLGSAASFDGTGRLSLDDTSWLGGLERLTVQALVKPDAAMLGSNVRILGHDGSSGITLGYLHESDDGVADVVYAAIGGTEGEALVVSRGGRQSSDRQLIHTDWQSSTAPQLFLNGVRATPSRSEARAGTVRNGTGPLDIGRDWIGLIDEIRITDRLLPTSWITLEARNMLAPELSYGLGQEERADTGEPPVVAVPFVVSTNSGKRVDIDVLSYVFTPQGGQSAEISSVSQPMNGSVSVVGNLVQYTPVGGFDGEDHFTYTISNGETQSVGRIVVTTIDPSSTPQDQTFLPPGRNLLANSKLLGESTSAADNWASRWPEEGGTIIFSAASTEGHRKVRFQSTGPTNRAAIEQIHDVEAGKQYVFSVHCAAIGAATSSTRVVINHAPFSSAAPLDGPEARPTLADMAPGQLYHYVFSATRTGPLKLILGIDGPGDVTLERPMLDQTPELRAYVATDPVQPSEVRDLNLDFVPYYGHYEGGIEFCCTHINTFQIKAGYYGFGMTMPRTGDIDVIQFQHTSNKSGETTKSAINGSNNHSFPASWALGLRVFKADNNWQINGSALRDLNWTYTNPDGNANNSSRMLMQLSLDNMSVTAGQRLLFLVYNREENPNNNYCSLNMLSNFGRPSFGQNPSRAQSLFAGDEPRLFVSSSLGGTLSTPSQRMYNFGLRYSNGMEVGSVALDGTPNAHIAPIWGNTRFRQKWSSPYWRRASKMAFAAYWFPDKRPESALTVRVSGPDISTMTLNIQPAQVQQFDFTTSGATLPYTHQVFDLPSDLVLSPSTVYMVEFYSPGTSEAKRYQTHMYRNYNLGVASARTVNPPPSSEVLPIEPHKWSGLAEISTNGGSSWSPAGWGQGNTNMLWALVIDRKISLTPDELPA